MLNENQQEELDGNELLLERAAIWLRHVERHRNKNDDEHATLAAWEFYCITRDLQDAARQLYDNCKAGV